MLQQVSVPNYQPFDSCKDLPSAPSLFQPINVYLPHEESEKEYEFEAQDNSSGAQTQL